MAGLFVAVALAAPIVGCNGSDQGRLARIQELEDKVEAQQRMLVAKDESIAAQARCIQELQGLDAQRRSDLLVRTVAIEFATLTGGYDDDRDGVDDGVVVYLRLRDQDGDTIKAAGSAEVRLFDLASPEGPRLVGHVRLGPEQLRPLWYGRLPWGSHYTIRVPWAGGAKRPDHQNITVHARFTDLLSGHTFESQQVVEVAGATAPASTQPTTRSAA